MHKIASALLVSLFAVGAFAQTPAPAATPAKPHASAKHASSKPAAHTSSHAKKKTSTQHAAAHPKSATKHAKKPSTKTHTAKKATPHQHKTA